MERLQVKKCPTSKRGSNASFSAACMKKVKVWEPSQGGRPSLSKGPLPFLPPPLSTLSPSSSSKRKKVAFNVAIEQPIGSLEYLKWALTLYEDFLTSGLSQRIEMDKRIDFRHTLLRHALTSASLAYKDVLETEKSEAERIELRDELKKARRELAAGVEREKWLAVEV
ncbi:hypothetical protein ACOSP7_013403 [Xanthoceras sorbifolium]